MVTIINRSKTVGSHFQQISSVHTQHNIYSYKICIRTWAKDQLNLIMLSADVTGLWCTAASRCCFFFFVFFCFRDVLWMQPTSRERQRFTLQQRGVAWRCAGHCCREQGAGCSMWRTTAASHHWTSANRGKHLGDSAVFRNLWKKTLTSRALHGDSHTPQYL